MKKEVLGIIPARGGSKGIPRKNMAILKGKPLIQYTMEAAQGSKLITRLILSSEDNGIIKYCKTKNVEVPFKRPRDLAKDDTPMLTVVIHALGLLEKEDYRPDYIILLQPTSPLRRSKHIDEALNILINSQADSIVSVIKTPHNFNPYSVMVHDGKYLKPFLSFDEAKNIRQQKPQFYARNGPTLLAFTYSCIIKKHSMFGDKILPYFMKREESADIDDELDLKMAEYILRTKQLNTNG